MSKKLDLSKTVHDLCKEYPELAEIMSGLGFTEMTKKVALNSVGRVMTIPKGAEIKGVDLGLIVKTLQDNGFEVTGLDEQESTGEAVNAEAGSDADARNKQEAQANKQAAAEVEESSADPNKRESDTGSPDQAQGISESGRSALLTSYVLRLSKGESLDSVRRDFVENFKDVDAAEIARAEQTLIASGVPIGDVQRLCDVHSALFHGATRTEQIANAEKAVQASLQKESGSPVPPARSDGADQKYRELCGIQGHPLQIFSLENQAISKQLGAIREALSLGEQVLEELDKTRQVAVHYAKKGDLLYPLLKTNYGFSGPSDVMWGVDDEIRDEMKKLSREAHEDDTKLFDTDWIRRLDAVLTRAEEMVYKEENILLPLCAGKFSEEDWKQIARDMRGYELCMISDVPTWEEAFEEKRAEEDNSAGAKGEIVFGSGHMSVPQLEAMLNTIPMELSFVDDQNINRFFNDDGKPKLFKRPLAALDREVFTCHPPKIEPMVRMIIQEFREGKRDSVEVWNSRGGEPVLIRYMAVRDKEGKYIGTLECVQRMGFAKEHFLKEGKSGGPKQETL